MSQTDSRDHGKRVRHDGHAGRPVPAPSDLHGFFNVDKPSGLTSHDVVANVRRAANRAKTGHAGTLDPLATGVLVVCIGRGTRLADDVVEGDKGYRATVRLGVETDTYDSEGTVLYENPVSVTSEQITRVLASLAGVVHQVPPMYSAIKVGGRKLYDLARAGHQVERQSRRVTIGRLELVGWESPNAIIEVACSKGTYVRSIAHDLGERLGTGAHLTSLTRLAVGRFSIDDAVPLDRLVAELVSGGAHRWLYPLDTPLIDLPALVLSEADATAVRHGQLLRDRGEAPAGAPRARAYTTDGRLAAILEATGTAWSPVRVFL